MQTPSPLVSTMKAFNQHEIEKGEIVGREKEYEELKTCIRQYELFPHFGLILIHGGSGVGKTTVVKEVLKDNEFLNELRVKRRTVFINVLLCTNKKCFIRSLSEQLFGEEKTFKEIASELNNETIPSILVFDEIDNLKNKCNDMYQWLLQALFGIKIAYRCVVIGLANETQDYYSMANDFTRSPYTAQLLYTTNSLEQICEIIRTKTNNTFDSKAVEYIAKEVYRKEGDLRKVYSACTLAIHLAIQDNSPVVKMIHAIKANGMNNGDTSTKDFLSRMGKYQKCLCASLFFCQNRNGVIGIGEWYEKFKQLIDSIKINQKHFTIKEFRNEVSILASQGVVRKVCNSSLTNIAYDHISQVTPTYDKLMMIAILSKEPVLKPIIEQLKQMSLNSN
ncbi:hypothetical protein EDI_033110 [Entamoeba dispar SAW760]|uniref:ATPase AAA-type core domain-containing protein n=1 Tax=Entamoeba dispar (strain ATCC PRA-260 / SAW760) TaxID=370354 RepID=B0E8G1_ENTDS|nr:uncharacterized protein EDI_033110 [Entamoeba dispar SAW760]EDR29204.1 hypothetical protein EDI_033110 [Entamoeba dispar SAW760]|eukprot:EDR29204.1 hypothetical protein EDI_033110 [Entamoeba dispar SAW760]